jgi:hypothetical protein
MPTEGIAIRVTVATEHPVRVVRASLGHRTSPRRGHTGFEGLPCRIDVYQASSLLGTREVSLFVWFGRGTPTIGETNRANIELRSAHLGLTLPSARTGKVFVSAMKSRCFASSRSIRGSRSTRRNVVRRGGL